ncbi:MAG: hypothetical protein AAGJ46_00845 [Planctomycetota bacterium]
MARRDTKLESEGAEFLVLGQLLVRGVSCYKAYTNMRDYDLVANSPDLRRAVTIQVKSRWDSSARGFFLRSISTDFVVAVFLNMSASDESQGPKPVYYVLPRRILRKYWRRENTPKLYLPDIYRLERYRSAWHMIVEELRQR